MDTITPVEGDGLLHPRGPLPPGIYWRRRLIVLGGTLIVLMLLVTQCARGGGKGKSPSTKPSGSQSSGQSAKSSSKAPTKSATKAASNPAPSTSTSSQPTQPAASSSSPQASSTPPNTAPQPCKVPTLKISVKAGGASFAAGVNPAFTLTIMNSGTTPCTRDLSAAATELLVTSGPDRIWSSDDCSKPGAGKLTTLKANEVKTVAVSWNRKRSKAGTSCVGADAKPGQYKVVGRLGDLRTAPDQFALL